MNNVYIKKQDSYILEDVVSSVREILLWGGIDKKISADTTILLKPNMLSKSSPDRAVTTHPSVVEAVIILLKEFGAKASNITVADSSGGPQNPMILAANYKVCGFADVASRQGVNLYTKLESKTVRTDGVMVKEFELIAPAVDCDIIINLPKFKTHVMTAMSGAVKNLFGTVPGLKKAEFHMRFPDKDNFSEMIVDLCETVKPDFTIVDGIVGMEGDGPGSGIPRKFGIMLAGENPYTIDGAICSMMGFELTRPPIMNAAVKRSLIGENFDSALLCGDTEMFRQIDNFVKPQSYRVDFSDRVPRAIRWATPTVEKLLAPKPKINKSACIGCGNCRDICPQKTITITDGKAVINMKNCIRCFCCHEMCPVKAIDVKRNIFFNI